MILRLFHDKASRFGMAVAMLTASPSPLRRPSLTKRLQISIILVGKGLVGCVCHLLLVFLHKFRVNLDLRRSKSEIGNEFLG